jgi:hypothetical protein
MVTASFISRVFLIFSGLLSSSLSLGSQYHVTINTSPLGGVSIGAAFDFIDGGQPTNSIVISNFATDGFIGIASRTGDVTGTLPLQVALSDTSFFNELYQPIQSATELSYDFESTAFIPIASFPDSFSFFLIDDVNGLPLLETTDPTGAGALFTLDIDGSNTGLLNIYNPLSTATPISWSVSPITPSGNVPEPSIMWLLAAGLLGGFCRRSRSRY